MVSEETELEMLNCEKSLRSTMSDNIKRWASHVLQIEPNFMKNCKYGRRMRRRLTPYHVPGGRVLLIENETIHERFKRKSENSDTGYVNEIIHERFKRISENSDRGNENEDLRDCEAFVSSVDLFKSKSLENINSSSHNFNFTHDFLIELESRKNSREAPDVELVSSKMKCLNV